MQNSHRPPAFLFALLLLAAFSAWAGPTALLTGGTGYIGSHVAVLLLQNGYDVILVDNLSNSDGSAVVSIEKITNKKVATYFFDLREKEKINQIFKDHPEISVVIHFAGYKSVNESVANPLDYYDNNVAATVNLLKVMKEHKCHRLVFSSSAAVYGEPKSVPIDELYPTEPTSPYGQTKLDIERMLASVAKADPLNQFVALRYFNPVGAHESGLLSEKPKAVPQNLVPFMVQVAQGQQVTLKIFGNDYETRDGTPVRDYFHIMDLAKGHVQAANHLLKKSPAGFTVYNLGSGTGHTVKEMLDAFNAALGRNISWEYAPRRPGDVAEVYANTVKAQNELGYNPTHTLEEMMQSALLNVKR